MSHQDSILAQMTRGEGLTLEETSETVWKEREAIFAAERTVLRIATLPEEVCAYADKLQLTLPGIEVRSVSQAIGIHDVALHGLPDAIRSGIVQLRDTAHPRTTIAVLQQSNSVEATAFEIEAPVLSLMKTIKHQFDPNCMLNPGKFFAEA